MFNTIFQIFLFPLIKLLKFLINNFEKVFSESVSRVTRDTLGWARITFEYELECVLPNDIAI